MITHLLIITIVVLLIIDQHHRRKIANLKADNSRFKQQLTLFVKARKHGFRWIEKQMAIEQQGMTEESFKREYLCNWWTEPTGKNTNEVPE